MNLKATRRRFFGLMGTGALSAKVATDIEVAKLAGLDMSGIGNASLRLSRRISDGDPIADSGPFVPYEKRLIAAGDYIQMLGIPEFMEFELRDRVRYLGSLDPDIANKRSWSMAVKIMTQRQRNYEREIEKVKRSAWIQRGRAGIKKILGFDWPW